MAVPGSSPRYKKQEAAVCFILESCRKAMQALDFSCVPKADETYVDDLNLNDKLAQQLFRFPRQALSEDYAVNQRLCFRAEILDPAVRGAMPWWEIGIGLFHCQMPLGHQAEIGTKSDAIQD